VLLQPTGKRLARYLPALDCGTVLWYYTCVHNKHRETLRAIFARPDRKDVRWEDWIALLQTLDALIAHKGGSMYGIRLGERYAVFHRPHPGNNIYPTDLKRMRRFLIESGVLEKDWRE
jgi:hypothetical protein